MKTLKLKKIPLLRVGNDIAVAKELGRMIPDAAEGCRRIARCGSFIEWISSNLEHGQLGPWIDAHKQEIGAARCTIFAWRQFYRSLMRAAGLEKSDCQTFSMPLWDALALPAAEIPKDLRAARAKIDAVIDGRTYRQLFLEFKQSELTDDDIHAKSGGDNTPRDGTGKRIAADRRSKLEITQEEVRFDWDNGFRRRLDDWLAHKKWQYLDDDRLVVFHKFLIDAKREVAALVAQRRIQP